MGQTPTEIMREYGLSFSTFYKWTNDKTELAVDGDTITAEEIKKLKKQIAKITTENEI